MRLSASMSRPFIADRSSTIPSVVAETGHAVATRPNRELDAGLGGEGDRSGHVGGIGRADDDDRMAIVEEGVDLAGFLVVRLNPGG